MNKESIKENVIVLCTQIFQNYNVDGNDIIEYADFINDLGMESITFISLVVEIESFFGIIIPDDLLNIDNCRSVTRISNLVFELLLNNQNRQGDYNDKT